MVVVRLVLVTILFTCSFFSEREGCDSEDRTWCHTCS